jgi:hypothetical protein
MQSLSRRGFSLLGATIVTLVILVSVVMNSVMPAFLGYSLGWRIVAVTLLIAPIGMALGVPFPTGMRVVEANCPQLLPWCWAINGFLSVFSSVFCIVASMVVGFTVVLLAVAVIYAVGFMALLPLIAASTSRNSCSPPRRSSPAPPPVTWRSPSA